MTPDFAKAVDPVFQYVLKLRERIDEGESPSPQDERAHIRGWIDQADAKLGQSPDWRLAKYALVCWIDELLVNAPWQGADWWKNNVFEYEFFNTRERFHQFYLRAKEAHTAGNRNALEVFYICVILGFRGAYGSLFSAQQELERYDLPPTVEAWARQIALAIQMSPKPPITSGGPMGAGAPPLDGQALFVTSSLAGVVLAAMFVGAIYLFYVQ